ncbi:PQQ-dependent sugar dehydrogenase [Gloeocapsopsis crepidinum LEGE 06123]|uniref:PQQ-dependent sugar dehydrogenase n=1 Tax=Gloeocapsopsis crepidinum LEGE 06123 TaxID=588587 RepID=A0ABR9UY51_9CHRO|nr:Ig-like domain-containing protein [Gloeocapsopsis crepidinum]MBE9192445.1 PQQ-dependent sugar dehydrogenase [Gloeocapsopsis crepidinum LEGE 06123]
MLNLDFSFAIPNTVVDKDGQGTGFTSVEPNSSGDQYQPSQIDLDTTAKKLTLTATKGSSAWTNNSLKNALQRGIDDTKPFTISTRLQGSPTKFATAFQQGGVFFGSDQDNYVKLVVINTGGANGLRLQFFKEENGVGSSIGEISNLNWSNINTLDLSLTGDPDTRTFKAAYRVNSNTAPATVVNQSATIKANTPFFIANSGNTRAGILASTTNAPNVAVAFDQFSIAQEIKINFQPNNANLPSGYVKDNGAGFNNVRGYGWVRNGTSTPLNIGQFARDRNRLGVEQRIDTLLHMQYPNSPAAAWEMAVPNGLYSVSVSVGDEPNPNGVYDSKHTIRVEGVTAIDKFQSNALQEYKLETVKVNVNDGRLTIDAIGGTNTKINFIEIFNITPGKHPNITGFAVDRDTQGRAYLNTSINVDVALARAGIGVEANSLNASTVKLYRTKDGQQVPGLVGTSGGNDVIVYQPSQNLAPNTNYTFIVTNNVKDESGTSFNTSSFTFNTGNTTTNPIDFRVNFTKQSVYQGAPLASLTVGPDGKLYAAGLDGKIRRWNIDTGSGQLSNLQTFAPAKLDGRAIIGIAFDPNNPNNLWISHNDPLFPQPAKDFTGAISKLVLNSNTNSFNANIQDYVVGLPRSAKDHLSNSLAFGSDSKLYMTQGSNSALGAPDTAWANRPERLLTAAVLQIDPYRNAPTGGFNVQTENYGGKQGNYNPFAINAPVKIYATGIRNAYDLVWHSNGSLYIPTNGSGANGNTPNDPRTSVNEALQKVAAQNDYLYRVVEGGYYGHPNPKRGEYILNGGNPTNGVDPAEVVRIVDPVTNAVYAGYPVGVQPEPNFPGFAYDFGRNKSPNGAIEYKSNTFGGALKNKLLVTQYSGGNDILALEPGANGNVPRGNVTRIVSGLNDPLDLVEDTRTNAGNLYVAELIQGGAAGQISLLKVS